VDRKLNLLNNKKWNFEKLKSNNQSSIDEYNERTLSTLLLMGWVLTLLPLAAVPFSKTKAGAIPAYLITFALFFSLYFLYKIPTVKKYSLIGLYISFSVLFLLGIYLSVIHSPNMRATILLGGFVIMPLSLIDRSRYIIPFLTFWLIVHTILAFYLKPLYALDDTINCLCSAILGIYLGRELIQVRLVSFEARRLLIIEKQTDELTGLFNRRKLYEDLTMLETANLEKPSGFMMLDIDHFKEFNDNFGHINGDIYLRHLGKLMSEFAQLNRLSFYRFGGEEFVIIAYKYKEKELFTIADNLRKYLQNTDINGQGTTVSIGVVYCGDEQVFNYEDAIDQADKAVYTAKHLGRNQVFMKHK
jgi:diguanylate cyclase (GGDEF)-like protein